MNWFKNTTMVIDILREIELPSMSMARRFVHMGAVMLDDERIVDPYQEVVIRPGSVLRIGKTRSWTYNGTSWEFVNKKFS